VKWEGTGSGRKIPEPKRRGREQNPLLRILIGKEKGFGGLDFRANSEFIVKFEGAREGGCLLSPPMGEGKRRKKGQQGQKNPLSLDST